MTAAFEVKPTVGYLSHFAVQAKHIGLPAVSCTESQIALLYTWNIDLSHAVEVKSVRLPTVSVYGL